ncbi:MAG: dienelactone hydrolase family protein [Bacteroidota bacterium]|nr:dienelactone hydrolase family protein [Bacteroidota bacterium]
MKRIILVLMCVFYAVNAGDKKEKANCCATTATEEFAAFGKSMAFVSLHEAPEPFEFISSGGEMKTIKTSDSMDARMFVVRSPQASNNYILLFHEWWGLNDYIKQEAQKIRRDIGNVTVIAVDLYDGKIATSPDSARAYVGQVNEVRARTIINAAIEYAGTKAKIATLGWCFGGGWSMQSALMLGKQAVGCVIYYGMPEKDVKKLSTLQCDVLGIFGSQDKFINPAVVAAFEKNMKEAKKKLEVKMYDADHAFANPSNPHHDKAMTADANAATVTYLRSKFVQP